MPRVTPILRRAHKAIEELDLLKVLQSEINHELSSHRFQVYIYIYYLQLYAVYIEHGIKRCFLG